MNPFKVEMQTRSSGPALAGMLIILLAWPAVVLAQSGMFTDPFRTANWRAVETDFMAWVEQVEKAHLESVRAAAEAALDDKEHHSILAAGNTIVVGAGGYDKVQDAVDAAPSGTRTIIQINAGTYKYGPS